MAEKKKRMRTDLDTRNDRSLIAQRFRKRPKKKLNCHDFCQDANSLLLVPSIGRNWEIRVHLTRLRHCPDYSEANSPCLRALAHKYLNIYIVDLACRGHFTIPSPTKCFFKSGNELVSYQDPLTQ